MVEIRAIVDGSSKVSFSQFNKRISIEVLVRTPDGLGGYKQDWQQFTECWAQIAPVRANEAIQLRYKEIKLLYKIYIRYYPNLPYNIRVRLKDRVFTAKHIINVNEDNKLLEILAEELVLTD
jgi:SPP1 family predicted phage head-tail adaptor